MGKSDRYLKGDWNVICDYCGEKKKQSECRTTWDNYLVCADTCWEPRQPQDFVRAKVDKQRTPPHLTRPDDQQNFTETTLFFGASALDNLIYITGQDLTAYTEVDASSLITVT
ncbi:MAG: hypothetical protein ACXAEN_21705, partial [Candidatus Thorarchaeota archaeon]